MRPTISAPRDGVLAHDHLLGPVEALGLREDRVGHSDLSDVVEERSGAERTELLGGEPQLPSDRERDAPDALRVAGRVRVASLDGGIQGLDRLEQRRLELARGLDEVVRSRLEVLVLGAHARRRAAHEDRKREPEEPEHDPDRVPDRPPSARDRVVDDGRVERGLGRAHRTPLRAVQRRPHPDDLGRAAQRDRREWPSARSWRRPP